MNRIPFWGDLGRRVFSFLWPTLLATAIVAVPAVRAGSPHFVGDITVTRDGNTGSERGCPSAAAEPALKLLLDLFETIGG